MERNSARGVSPGGSHYYPALPYASYARMRLEDVIDLKAYVDTLPAVAGPGLTSATSCVVEPSGDRSDCDAGRPDGLGAEVHDVGEDEERDGLVESAEHRRETRGCNQVQLSAHDAGFGIAAGQRSRDLEIAMVIVTHNRALAMRADRVLLLEDGRVSEVSNVEALP